MTLATLLSEPKEGQLLSPYELNKFRKESVEKEIYVLETAISERQKRLPDVFDESWINYQPSTEAQAEKIFEELKNSLFIENDISNYISIQKESENLKIVELLKIVIPELDVVYQEIKKNAGFKIGPDFTLKRKEVAIHSIQNGKYQFLTEEILNDDELYETTGTNNPRTIKGIFFKELSENSYV